MATIKEIAEIVGVSSAAVSRVLNYDEGISVSEETRGAIFATAEKIGYKKKVIYPKIENVALLYFTDNEDELEDVFYRGVREEVSPTFNTLNGIVARMINPFRSLIAGLTDATMRITSSSGRLIAFAYNGSVMFALIKHAHAVRITILSRSASTAALRLAPSF